MKRYFCFGLPIAILSAAASAAPKDLLGAWQCETDKGQVALLFQSANLLNFACSDYKYTATKKLIRVTGANGERIDYEYELEGRELAVILPTGDIMDCARQAAATAPPENRPGPAERQAAPAQGGGGRLNSALAGMLCSYSGSSSSTGSYSSSNRVSFDGRGRFVVGSESSFTTYQHNQQGDHTGTGIGASSSGGNGGRYEVTALQVAAPIRVVWDNGEQDGAAVHFIAGGRITEIKYGTTLYAAGLCD